VADDRYGTQVLKQSVSLPWRVFFLVFVASMGAEARAESEDGAGVDWEWSVTPYIWLADTSYKLRVDGRDIGEGNIDFGELAEALDGAFQVVAEAGRGRWSGFVDFSYLSISEKQLVDLDGLGSLRVATNSEQYFVDAAVAFWPWKEVSGFNIYAGVRYTDLEDRIKVDVVESEIRLGQIKADRSFTDVLVGMRDRFKIAENWAVVMRMDYSFGDSEGIFLAQGALRWSVGRERRHGIVFGYRYKDAGFENSNREENYKYKGPVLGFNFRF
jgi:hypothetical protein